MNGREKTLTYNECSVTKFFMRSDLLDHDALRPISHVRGNWELTCGGDDDLYESEEDSFAHDLNILIREIAQTSPPLNYHDYENSVSKLFADARSGRYGLINGLWHDNANGRRLTADEVNHMLEQGSCGSDDAPQLLLAAAGRVNVAFKNGQHQYDDMEQGHRLMLGGLLTVILFRRSDS